MLELLRTVRFSVNPDRSAPIRGDNGYAGVPPMRGLGRHYELTVACGGDADPATGYFINIKDIDRAVRTGAIPVLTAACAERPDAEPGTLLPELLRGVQAHLASPVRSLRWHLSPYYSVEMASTDPHRVLVRQRFEFAAAHRLHCPTMTQEENRAYFGRCNNPAGHGHNYVVEPCVSVPTAPQGSSFSLADLERAVTATVLDRFDHKHLNIDTVEFRTDGGLNPSVENIARVCFELLRPVVAGAPGGAELRCVTVWETEKTSCTYPG